VTVSSRRGWADPLLVLLALAWLVAPPLLGFIGAFVKALALSGAQPTPIRSLRPTTGGGLLSSSRCPCPQPASRWPGGWDDDARSGSASSRYSLRQGPPAVVLVDLQPAPTPAPTVISCQAYSGGSNNCHGG